MTNSSAEGALAGPGFAWAPWAVIAYGALLPTVGYAEAVLALSALATLVILLVQRFRHGDSQLGREAWALSTALFLCYWLPELLSAPDALDPVRAWRETVLDLRYLPFLWMAAIAVSTERGRGLVLLGIGLLAMLWVLDGALQAASGHSLGGGNVSDRLSGIFGADNLKLGLVLAALSPFLLELASRRLQAVGWMLASVLVGIVVLLAGTRAAWLVLALVLALDGWRRFGRKRLLAGLAATLVAFAGVAAWQSDQFQARLQRSATVFEGGTSGLDEALSYRLGIWRAAWDMGWAHPVNGVGVRGYREAYALHAPADDYWLSEGRGGALHAHQLLLEIWSETGSIGLLLWGMGAALAWRAWRWASEAARRRAAVPGLALLGMVFPINTHLAFYSSFWGGLFLLLLALYAGCLFGREPAART